MNLSVKALRNTFMPKGNGIARQFRKNASINTCLNGFSFGSAVGGITALVLKDPNVACAFAGVSLGSAGLANLFCKKTKLYEKQLINIVKRQDNIEIAKLENSLKFSKEV